MPFIQVLPPSPHQARPCPWAIGAEPQLPTEQVAESQPLQNQAPYVLFLTFLLLEVRGTILYSSLSPLTLHIHLLSALSNTLPSLPSSSLFLNWICHPLSELLPLLLAILFRSPLMWPPYYCQTKAYFIASNVLNPSLCPPSPSKWRGQLLSIIYGPLYSGFCLPLRLISHSAPDSTLYSSYNELQQHCFVFLPFFNVLSTRNVFSPNYPILTTALCLLGKFLLIFQVSLISFIGPVLMLLTRFDCPSLLSWHQITSL